MRAELAEAKSYALRLLVFRRRTRHELTLRLARQGFSAEVSRHVLDWLGEYGYINDTDFARCWVEQRLGKRGFRGLRQELRAKGILGEIIDRVLAELEGDAEYQAAVQLVKRELRRRGGVVHPARLAGALHRRGFSGEIIRQICYRMRDEPDWISLDKD